MGQKKQSILKRLLGNPVSDKTAKEWPELARSWAGREIEKPEETASTLKVRPMNFLEKAILPGAAGVTWPWKTVALNREGIQEHGLDLGDVLVHELEHIKQFQPKGMLRKLYNAPKDLVAPYHKKSYEKEAFDAEYNRKARRYDIELKTPKSIIAQSVAKK